MIERFEKIAIIDVNTVFCEFNLKNKYDILRLRDDSEVKFIHKIFFYELIDLP